jgi:16S rRNA (uracil1498-N3)-methyltransferase
METRRFFSLHPVKQNRALITGDELHHLKTVNRAKTGNEIEVIDGKGTLYYGKIRELNPHEAVVDITGREKQDKPPVTITIAPSLIKKKAMHGMVEKLAEIGVDEIRPVIFARTDEKYNPAMLKKWQRIALQALKVNKKLWPTAIYPPVSPRELVEDMENSADAGSRILLHVEGETAFPRSICPPMAAVIGPPGDILPEEREELKEKGFVEIKLNDAILKTETAAISIAAILKFNGDIKQCLK